MKIVVLAALASFALGSAANAVVIEDFETGAFGAEWVALSGGAPSIIAAAAHDGSFGARTASGGQRWDYRTDAAATITDGSVLSMWTRALNGGSRTYLGFGADAGGASSFVLAPNTGELQFQNNIGYGFTTDVSTPFAVALNQWYLMTVTFGPETVGRVYGSDGTTLLGELSATGLARGVGGGVAVRAFNADFDTLSLGGAAAPAVPEPATWAMLIAGFGLVGASARRRRQASVSA